MRRILNVVLQEPNLERLIDLTNKELTAGKQSSVAKVRATDAELSDTKSRLRKLYEAIETSSLDLADISPRIKELRAQELLLVSSRDKAMADTNRATDELVDRKTVLAYMKDLKALASAGTTAQRKAFLNGFIKSLTFTGSEVEIEYSLPVPSGQTSEINSGVLPITQFGGA